MEKEQLYRVAGRSDVAWIRTILDEEGRYAQPLAVEVISVLCQTNAEVYLWKMTGWLDQSEKWMASSMVDYSFLVSHPKNHIIIIQPSTQNKFASCL